MKSNGVMDWDDPILTDGEHTYIELPEGDYTFTVTELERGWYKGSDKVPEGPKATIHIAIDSEQGKADSRFDLILNSAFTWKMANFFRCIGMKKHGEPMTSMKWGDVIGKRGRAHIKPRPFTDKNGMTRHANDVDRFFDYDEEYMTNAPVAGENDWENEEV